MLQIFAHAITYSVFFVSNLFFWGGLYGRLRRYKSEIFFSYSHKDSQFAEVLINRLKNCKFRLWVDFGKKFTEDQVLEILKNVIRKREIFILLGSKNSANSEWVKSEIEEASKGHSHSFATWEWRDFIVIAKDNYGIDLYNTLSNTLRYQQQRYESLQKQENDEIAKLANHYRKTSYMKYILFKIYTKLVVLIFGADYKKQPTWTRGFTSTVKLFDLRDLNDDMVAELLDYLKRSTEPFMLQTSLFRRTWIFVALFWFFGLTWSGFCIVKGITIFDMIFRAWR